MSSPLMVDFIEADRFWLPFLRQLRSYTPLLVPALFIYCLESRASLKVLHAVKQIPPVELEPSNNPLISSFNECQRIISKRRSISRARLRERLEQCAIVITFVAICTVQQIITGVVNDDASEIDNDSYKARFESSTDLFRTFFDPKEEPDWTYWSPTFGLFYREEFYYAVVMPLFGVFVLMKALYLLTGLKDRVVFRSLDGSCFTTTHVNERIRSRWHLIIFFSMLSLSLLVSIGAFWTRDAVDVSILCGAIIYLFASYNLPQTSISVKQFLFVSPLMVTALGTVTALSYVNGEPIKMTLSLPIKSWETDWTGLLLSCCLLSSQQGIISLCYRLDYALSLSDEPEMLAGPPNVDGLIAGAIGTRIVYPHSLFSSRNVLGGSLPECSPKFAKVYLNTAICTWVLSACLLAVLNVWGYVEFRPEHIGIYQLYLSGAFIPLALVIVAIARGEIRKIWKYKEEIDLKPRKKIQEDDLEAKEDFL